MLKINLEGQKFGRWVVNSFSHFAPNRKGSVWNCVCECGEEKKVRGSFLRSGESRSCGCLHKEITRNRVPGNFIDMSGQIFGRLTVVERAGKTKNLTSWVCKCTCGKIIKVLRCNLIYGRQFSCGCLGREMANKRHLSHGQSKTTLYKVWVGMITRCYNPKVKYFHHYGGRGITVSEEWRSDFMSFYADMNEGYKRGLQLDRIDVNGNYCKQNCRWITAKQNCRNRRNTLYLTINGEKIPLAEWAENIGKTYQFVHSRKDSINNGSYFSLLRPVFDKSKMILGQDGL